MVGPDEKPFGIQKDFLCDRSEYYRKHFAEQHAEGGNTVLEHVVKLPDASPEIFGLVQQFLYTGQVISDPEKAPSFESLVGLWKLGHKLDVYGLCDSTLEAMVECRRLTGRIPATPLLIQVWRETPEGSSIRVLLLSWAAEYMRASDARAEFAKSLPQEVLSELVVTMSSFDNTPPAVQVPSDQPSTTATTPLLPLRKNVHYLEEPTEEEVAANTKRNRRSGGVSSEPTPQRKNVTQRKEASSPPSKPHKRRSSAAYLEGRVFTTQQKLDFCSDLLTRMLSGPGETLNISSSIMSQQGDSISPITSYSLILFFFFSF